MGISISKSNCFHLQTKHSSYIFQVLDNGDLGHVYYGSKIHLKDRYPDLMLVEERGFEPYSIADNPAFQPSLMRFEYGGYGKGDFRHPAYQIQDATASRISQLVYHSHEIVAGKPNLKGLPASYAGESDAVETLIVTMVDDMIGLVVHLSYTIFPEVDVIARSVRFENKGSKPLKLLKAMSLQLDLPDSDYDFIHFTGAWLRERQFERHPLRAGLQAVDSLRHSSSPQHNPFVMLASPNTTEDTGVAYGFNFIYSGNHLEQIEVDHFGKSRVLVGLNPFDFSWELQSGASFQTPEAIQSFTVKGLNHLSQSLHRFYQEHLVNPNFANQERPILINSWEATYFDLTEEKLYQFADRAKELGIELLVVDDGWYGHRNDDSSSLGDWFVNRDKLPNGLKPLSDYVHRIGLKFGLWFEPEMISEDSNLFCQHPEWRIESPGRQPSLGRQQFVLDFSRQEVVDAIFEQMSRVIDETNLDYIKWDMNRHITDSYSLALPPSQQQEFGHRYILGVYCLYERLTKRYPEVLFESCASGGGRFDLGMMYYAPQAWTSDDTDPIERLKIQFGTSYGYSLSMMGNHVSVAPNHQSGRMTLMSTRAHVAFFGLLGYEFDITTLSQKEMEDIKNQIVFYKQYRHLFQFGQFYRLISPFERDKNQVSWQLVSKDKSLSIAAHYQILNQLNPGTIRFRFKGLDADKQYRVSGYQGMYFGDELMNAGLDIRLANNPGERVLSTKDFDSRLVIITEK